MRTSAQDTDSRAARRSSWVLWGMPFVVLALLGCCAAAIWYLPFFSFLWVDRLSYVQGQVEVLAHGNEGWKAAHLSPNGRRMVLLPADGLRDQHEPLVLDLSTGQRWPVHIDIQDMAWLNDTQFLVLDAHTNEFAIINAVDTTMLSAQLIPDEQYEQPNAFARILADWRQAQRVYVLFTFVQAGYTIVTEVPGRPALVYRSFHDTLDTNVQALIDQVAHVDVPQPGWHWVRGTGDQVVSPDGRWYTTFQGTRRGNVNASALIYTRAGQLVAEGYKAGWDPIVLGWAYDSSGVYVQFSPSGDAASMLQPARPIFKLSPPSPGQPSGWLWPAVIASCIAASIASGGWLWWRGWHVRRAR
jgi:hypothetical protein